MSSIETTKEAVAERNGVSLYSGCFVLLKKGDVVGPLSQHWRNLNEPIYAFGTLRWNQSGRTGLILDARFDVVRVLSRAEADEFLAKRRAPADVEPKIERAVTEVSIAPVALRAAMEAGLRAKPAYEDFVKAIVTAAFAAMPMDTFAAVREKEAEDQVARVRPNVTLAEMQQVVEDAFDLWERQQGSRKQVSSSSVARYVFNFLCFKMKRADGKHNSEIDKAAPENPKAEPTVPRRPMTTPAGEMLHLIPEWRLHNLYAYGTITQEQFNAEMVRRHRS